MAPKTPILGVLLAALAFAACDPGEGLTGQECEQDADCDDGLFCNGEELCGQGTCFRFSPPVCDDGLDCTSDECSETRQRCVHEAPDADGDGVADATCIGLDGLPLGVDCDDGDPNRYPGNVEVCDAEHHDEDCDMKTSGAQDDDADGWATADCCNEDGDGVYCGTCVAAQAGLQCFADCDDTRVGIGPGSQTCDEQVEGGVLICGSDGVWQPAMCDPDGPNVLCHPQPTGEGVCV